MLYRGYKIEEIIEHINHMPKTYLRAIKMESQISVDVIKLEYSSNESIEDMRIQLLTKIDSRTIQDELHFLFHACKSPAYFHHDKALLSILKKAEDSYHAKDLPLAIESIQIASRIYLDTNSDKKHHGFQILNALYNRLSLLQKKAESTYKPC